MDPVLEVRALRAATQGLQEVEQRSRSGDGRGRRDESGQPSVPLRSGAPGRWRLRIQAQSPSTTSRSPTSTFVPGWTATSATVPSAGLETVDSIFIASTTASAWP